MIGTGNVSLLILGAGLVILCLHQMISTLRKGIVRTRGDRKISRKDHQVMFWFNFGGLGIACILGCWLVVWALVRP